MLALYLSIIEDHNNNDDFERIYHKYSKLMFKVAISYTNNHHLAEEAVQNVFINVAKNIDKIKKFDEDCLEIYLCKASKNSAYTIMKKERRIASQTVPFDNVINNNFNNEQISEQFFQNELIKMIFYYVQAMKPQCRDILTLYFLHNFSLKEISIILSLPLSTVKTRFYKSRKLIQEKFEEYKND